MIRTVGMPGLAAPSITLHGLSIQLDDPSFSKDRGAGHASAGALSVAAAVLSPLLLAKVPIGVTLVSLFAAPVSPANRPFTATKHEPHHSSVLDPPCRSPVAGESGVGFPSLARSSEPRGGVRGAGDGNKVPTDKVSASSPALLLPIPHLPGH